MSSILNRSVGDNPLALLPVADDRDGESFNGVVVDVYIARLLAETDTGALARATRLGDLVVADGDLLGLACHFHGDAVLGAVVDDPVGLPEIAVGSVIPAALTPEQNAALPIVRDPVVANQVVGIPVSDRDAGAPVGCAGIGLYQSVFDPPAQIDAQIDSIVQRPL